MKISFISTVLNEENSIEGFLDSLGSQTRPPDEVIIVDGGSTDKTIIKIKNFKIKINKFKINLLKRKGFNRAQGRNEAARLATGEIITISDAGCILDKKWLEKIIKPFEEDKKIEAVAGYYKAAGRSVFEKCVAPFVLVMPDKAGQNNFLPASRSMAIRKETFSDLGGFPEQFSDNEDFVFSNTLRKAGKKIVFQKGAIVNWIPRSNLKDFWTMIYRFAQGDAQAGLRKLKVFSIFLRYLLFFAIFWFVFNSRPVLAFLTCFLLLGVYLLWSISKNYRYVKEIEAFFWLPVLQLVSDFAVMSGSINGLRLKVMR